MRFRGNLSKSRLRKDSRSIPVWGSPDRGDGQDNKKYYRCWNCGFICNVERDLIGDSQSLHGAVYTDYSSAADIGTLREQANADIETGSFVAAQLGSDGNALPVKNAIMVAEGGSGCPFCHTLNWRGDF